MSARKIELAAAVCRVVAGLDRLLGAGRKRQGTLIFPPTGAGSLGDEAMVSALAGEAAAAGATPVTVFARGNPRDWPQIPGVDELLPPMPGGLMGLARLIKLLRRHRHVFVVGADCIDGNYSLDNSLRLLGFARLAGILGAETTVVGSSYKPGAAPETARAIAALGPNVRMCARDPVSRQRMIDAASRDVLLVADAAFMLRPLDAPAELDDLVEWVTQARSGDGTLLGVNFNRQVIKGGDPAAVELLFDANRAVLRERLDRDPDLSLLFLPHDYRGDDSDHHRAERLCESLRPDFPDRVEVTPARRLPGEVKALAGECDAVLTGRMHLAIAALGMSTPVVCVAYQGKFEGLYKHFELHGGLIKPEDATRPQKLGAVLDDVLARTEQLAQRIRERLPAIKELSRRNLGSLAG